MTRWRYTPYDLPDDFSARVLVIETEPRCVVKIIGGMFDGIFVALGGPMPDLEALSYYDAYNVPELGFRFVAPGTLDT
jgi:hypothetical protein